MRNIDLNPFSISIMNESSEAERNKKLFASSEHTRIDLLYMWVKQGVIDKSEFVDIIQKYFQG